MYTFLNEKKPCPKNNSYAHLNPLIYSALKKAMS